MFLLGFCLEVGWAWRPSGVLGFCLECGWVWRGSGVWVFCLECDWARSGGGVLGFCLECNWARSGSGVLGFCLDRGWAWRGGSDMRATSRTDVMIVFTIVYFSSCVVTNIGVARPSVSGVAAMAHAVHRAGACCCVLVICCLLGACWTVVGGIVPARPAVVRHGGDVRR
jgi:hypothetical protein